MNRSWVRFPQAAQMRPPGSGWAFLYALLVACCLLLVAPTDLRLPRGLPARSPSAPRASLGASARSPARPRRPRGGLQSVGVSVCCTARPRHRPPALQPAPPVSPAPFTPAVPWCCVLPGQVPPPPAGAAAWPSGPPMWSGLSCWDFGALRCVLLQTSSIGGVFRVDF